MSVDPRSVPEAYTSARRSDLGLSMRVVEYSDRADRCTVFPPGLSGDARMSTWLSADRSAFVPLSEME
ncbi:hypothetical protein ACFQGE_14385 [Halomicroarcula sp. GCM10025817]|uniref:DUF7511 domain-containing protein n=1 Tax=Haloarcula TaxID=2237 RepID=UPI0023E7E9AF|nr:hypothetical protein [Halomicroarcula sp. SYNS111]